MFIFYDFIFFIFILFSIPCLFIKNKFHKDLFKRFYLSKSILDKLEGHSPIWIHAVSVGEVMAVRNFVNSLSEDNEKILISTVTVTGNKIARQNLGQKAIVMYLPVDLSFIVQRFIKLIKPSVFIAVETEIWPNLTRELKKNNISIAVVNGRISDNSFKGYKIIQPLLRGILRKIDIFCVQSELYAKRIISLGADKEKIKVTGNMKFDNVSYPAADSKLMSKPLLIAGSTHKGEEKIILEVYKKLLNNYPDLQLLVAPRHIERVQEIKTLIEEFGFKCIRIYNQDIPDGKSAVFLLDSVGILSSLYSIATIVFVGGSLVRSGGHNIIEPAFFSKPILFGPYMGNFKDISELFLNKNAAILVNNSLELEKAIKELLGNDIKRDILGNAAKMVIDENRGATQKSLELIRGL